jgi:aspartyl-tRNA(Asn)/glutamyl-tRNA(Gln) amidotransferase subunit A
MLRELVTTIFKQVDVLHFPALGVATPTLEAARDTAAAQPALLERMTRFTRWVNYLGLPALAVPCGFTAQRMPVGFQLIGRPFSEQRLFRIGHAYQQATSWQLAAPPR